MIQNNLGDARVCPGLQAPMAVTPAAVPQDAPSDLRESSTWLMNSWCKPRLFHFNSFLQCVFMYLFLYGYGCIYVPVFMGC